MKSHLPLGVFMSLLCALLFSFQTALVKLWALILPPLPILIFIQSLIALCLMLLVLCKKGSQHPRHVIKTKLDLLAGLCMAVSLLIVRKVSATDSSATTTFYYLFFATCLSGLLAIPCWQSLSATTWLPLLVIGGLFFLVQCATTYSVKYANAQLVSTLFYSNIIFAALLSWLFWESLPSTTTWLGVLFLVAGGMLCIRAEHLHNKKTNLSGDLVYAKET